MTFASQRYRMLALDVDGTIAGKDYAVPAGIRAAIRDAISAGVTVSLVTGRIRASALRYASECEANGPTISHQGAVITAPDGVTDLHIERLEPGVAGLALEQMRGARAQISVFADDEIWVEEINDWARQYAIRMKKTLQTDHSLDVVVSRGPTVVMATDEPDRISQLTHTLRSRLNGSAAVTRSLPHFCEVGSVNATKAASLARVCENIGVGREEVIAVGDGEGDISMIKWAGLGVSVGDSHPETVAASDMNIDGPETNGLANFIHALLNQGKLGG